jgi:hypothetical protein
MEVFMAEIVLYSFTLLLVFYTLYRVKKNHYQHKKKGLIQLSLYTLYGEKNISPTSIEGKKKELLCDAKVDHKKKGV